jgi:very-short-patch-repair endonuclease
MARVDFAYSRQKIAIELDGYAYHHGKGRWQSDLTRRNALARLGWRVMHISHNELVRNPGRVIELIRDALSRNS